MAQKKTSSNESILKAIAAEKQGVVEREKTKRFFIGCFFGTIALGIVAWAAVRITDRPPWLVFALAFLTSILGPGGYLLIKGNRISRITIDLMTYAGLRKKEEREEQVDQQGQLPLGENDES